MRVFFALVTMLAFMDLAFSNTPKPAKCPGISAIQAVGLHHHSKDNHVGLYVVYQFHKYDTPETWFFGVGVPVTSASSSYDALKKARAVLPYLSGNPIPVPLEEDRWICTYDDFNNGYKAHAITPDWE